MRKPGVRAIGCFLCSCATRPKSRRLNCVRLASQISCLAITVHVFNLGDGTDGESSFVVYLTFRDGTLMSHAPTTTNEQVA